MSKKVGNDYVSTTINEDGTENTEVNYHKINSTSVYGNTVLVSRIINDILKSVNELSVKEAYDLIDPFMSSPSPDSNIKKLHDILKKGINLYANDDYSAWKYITDSIDGFKSILKKFSSNNSNITIDRSTAFLGRLKRLGMYSMYSISKDNPDFIKGQELAYQDPNADLDKYIEDNNIQDIQNFKFGFNSIVKSNQLMENY